MNEATQQEPIPLRPVFYGKLWGMRDLTPWFPNSGEKVGEVWLMGAGTEPLPLLVKFLFASEKLSVQVHPDDEYARVHENSLGKSEMWHVLRAEPGATLGIGLTRRLSREQLKQAALSGEIKRLVNWVPVQAGDTVLIPAGTIHAIGSGLVLLEIQQPSDVTYRLFDYGRNRELHLDKALDVAAASPCAEKVFHAEAPAGVTRLVSCPWFVADSIVIHDRFEYRPGPSPREILVAVEGRGVLAGRPFAAGAAWELHARTAPFDIEPATPCRLIRTYVP